MSKLLKRVEAIEQQLSNKVIPDKDRIIVIPYPAGDEDTFDRLSQQRLEEIRGKYGQSISEADLLFIGVKKFTREYEKFEE